jgi:hypothetical protein
MNIKLKKVIYESFICCHILYRITIWFGAKQSMLKPLNSVLNKAWSKIGGKKISMIILASPGAVFFCSYFEIIFDSCIANSSSNFKSENFFNLISTMCRLTFWPPVNKSIETFLESSQSGQKGVSTVSLRLKNNPTLPKTWYPSTSKNKIQVNVGTGSPKMSSQQLVDCILFKKIPNHSFVKNTRILIVNKWRQ